jgi:hypothetical protein
MYEISQYQTLLLLFVVAIGIGIVTGYLLKFMPKKQNKEDCRWYKEGQCYYWKRPCHGKDCSVYVKNKEG